MELDITALFDGSLDAWDISNSVANYGPNAAQLTWSNAMAAARDYPLATDENADTLRDYFREFGAWSRAELDAMSLVELSALCWQDAAADARDYWDIDNADFSDCIGPDCDSIVSEQFVTDTTNAGSQIYYHAGRFYRYYGN